MKFDSGRASQNWTGIPDKPELTLTYRWQKLNGFTKEAPSDPADITIYISKIDDQQI